jgi:hypothetical protein
MTTAVRPDERHARLIVQVADPRATVALIERATARPTA